MIRPPETLESERLRLDRLVRRDATDVFEGWAQDEAVTRYLVWRPHRSILESEAHAERCESAWEEGSEFVWIIRERESGAAVGSIAAHVRGHRVALGYLLATRYQGRGFMTETVRLVSDVLLQMEDVFRVWAVCDHANTPSARVLERAGFEEEGILKRWVVHPNVSAEPRDARCFARVVGP